MGQYCQECLRKKCNMGLSCQECLRRKCNMGLSCQECLRTECSVSQYCQLIPPGASATWVSIVSNALGGECNVGQYFK